MRKFSRILFLVLAFTSCAINFHSAKAEINSFEECANAGNLIVRTMPARCVLQDGRTFIAPMQVEKTAQSQNNHKLCIDKCGDGNCQEIVCMGEGCPCPESHDSCPQDCKN